MGPACAVRSRRDRVAAASRSTPTPRRREASPSVRSTRSWARSALTSREAVERWTPRSRAIRATPASPSRARISSTRAARSTVCTAPDVSMPGSLPHVAPYACHCALCVTDGTVRYRTRRMEAEMPINPAPQVLLYPRIRKSPFFYASRRHGVATHSFYNHTYHPRHYGDPIAEYWALLEGVTLWDVGVERQIEISGPDAFDFTNLLITRDLSKCKVGQCKYVFLTDQHGGVLNDLVLLRLEENRFWLSLADSDILLWARGVAPFAGPAVTTCEAEVGPVHGQGPKPYEVMRDR